jgi:3-deoxy-7-phosphoheptulonate synthase
VAMPPRPSSAIGLYLVGVFPTFSAVILRSQVYQSRPEGFKLAAESDAQAGVCKRAALHHTPPAPPVYDARMADDWSVDSWTRRARRQALVYDDPSGLQASMTTLKRLPPLVTSWEIERLRVELAEAESGKRFVLQGGDCAETFIDCQPSILTSKLKILLQMSLVLIHAAEKPVVRIGRFAGQYTKPRSSPTEVREGTELPSYFGDLVNRPDFTVEGRRPDPSLLVKGYQHAALTLNFIRSLSDGGFSDARHPEYWDLTFLQRAAVPREVREEYEQTTTQLAEALRFMAVLGERTVAELTRVEFFTSHEGLHLEYESALTQQVPRRTGYYDLSTHLPWIGNRTRELDGAHVEFFRGVRNPVGVKIGPTAVAEEVVALLNILNPRDEPGKVAFITRMGLSEVTSRLPPILEAVKQSRRRALWMTDPMHGNTKITASGHKTRHFEDILLEVERTFDAHAGVGTCLGGVHFELTGEDVNECVGGAAGVTETDLAHNYETACDPRLNYRQALEMSFLIGRRLRAARQDSAL